MNILNEILDRYQSADMGARLNMYLQYRDHRDAFILLDMKKDKDACTWAGSVPFFRKNSKRKLMATRRRKEPVNRV
jgi:hypothetical protein